LILSLFLLVPWGLTSSPPPAPVKNLVPNGSFEEGAKGIPKGWSRPDDLTTFWVKAPERNGKCLKVDTDVYREEYLARRKEMEKDPVPPAKPKTPTKGKKYDTVAGVEGVPYYSAWIPVESGRSYRLEVDFRAESGRKAPKVFIKGYLLDPRRPKPYRRRVAYKKYLTCKGSEEWKTFRTVFNPTARNPEVRWIRVMLFAYWPPGVYYFDNVKVVPLAEEGEEKSKAPEKRRAAKEARKGTAKEEGQRHESP